MSSFHRTFHRKRVIDNSRVQFARELISQKVRGAFVINFHSFRQFAGRELVLEKLAENFRQRGGQSIPIKSPELLYPHVCSRRRAAQLNGRVPSTEAKIEQIIAAR